VSFTVDTSEFDRMCSELAAIANAPPDQVLREEVGKVLSQAIVNTKAASVSDIKRHHDAASFTLQPPSLYSPKEKTRRHLRRGKVLYNLKYRYPDQLWASIQKARLKDLMRRIRARGLAKQSWYKIGLMLGLSVEAPAYVKNAVPTTGKTYKDETVVVQQGTANNAITINTSQPTLVAIDGELALQRAINGRANYFIQNVIHSVFDTMADAAKKYPGVFIS